MHVTRWVLCTQHIGHSTVLVTEQPRLPFVHETKFGSLSLALISRACERTVECNGSFLCSAQRPCPDQLLLHPQATPEGVAGSPVILWNVVLEEVCMERPVWARNVLGAGRPVGRMCGPLTCTPVASDSSFHWFLGLWSYLASLTLETPSPQSVFSKREDVPSPHPPLPLTPLTFHFPDIEDLEQEAS